MNKTFSFVSIIFLISLFVSAQPGSTGNPVTGLSFMLGEWHGSGWMLTRNGKQYSTVTETAECRQECSIILVTGKGIKTDSLTNEKQTVHDAFGVITFDKNTGKFLMRAYRNGEETIAEIELAGDKILRWNLPTPGGGTVKFTADFSEPGKWKEIGEFSRDGTNWTTMMEMELDKKL